MFDILKKGARRLVRTAGSATGATALIKLGGKLLGVDEVPQEVYLLGAGLSLPAEKMGREALRKIKGDYKYNWLMLLRDISAAVCRFCNSAIKSRKGGDKNGQ